MLDIEYNKKTIMMVTEIDEDDEFVFTIKGKDAILNRKNVDKLIEFLTEELKRENL